MEVDTYSFSGTSGGQVLVRMAATSGDLDPQVRVYRPDGTPKSDAELKIMRSGNNPNNEPVGNFTGRCAHCGSSDLWDDNLAYGCNSCGAMLGGN